MRPDSKSRAGTYEWNTDDWDSVDWSEFWDRQIGRGTAGVDSALASATRLAAPRRQVRLADLLQRESLSDTVDRLSRPVPDTSIPWVPDAAGNTIPLQASDSSDTSVREVWCQAG